MRKVAIIITLFFSLIAYSQERPKIGLVLSGGGAKGLAHIGVLQAIDSARLNIDYITGTSMGSIVAAMYAAGYNAKQIRQMAIETDWMNVITSSSARFSDMSIDAKDEYGNYIVEVPIDKGLKFKLPTGMEPQEVMLLLEKIFFPFYKTKDFSQLSIPFKCIATNMRDGSAVVIDKGDLAFATRSSMAIPGVFAATKYKNTILVDGGVVRNFPVSDVKEMGADYVIGVNLFEGLTDPKLLSNPLDIMMQVINFRDAEDLVTEKRICDMVLEPDVSNYSAGSFSSSNEILAIGDSIGRDFYPLFKQLADSLNRAYGVPYADTNRFDGKYDKVRITDFEVDGLRHTDKHFLLHNLKLNYGGVYSVDDIHESIRKAYSTRYYSKIQYELFPTDATNGVMMKLTVEEIPMSFLNVGLSYNTFTGASLILGYTGKNLIFERSLTTAKVSLSESFRAMTSHRQYYGRDFSKFAEAKWQLDMFELPIYAKKQQEALYDYMRNDFSLSIGKVAYLNHDVQFKVGYEFFALKPNISNDASAYDGRIGNLYFNLRWRYNTLNRKYLPQKGAKIEMNIYAAFKPRYRINYDYERDNIYRLSWEGSFYQQLHPRSTIFEGFGVVGTYGDKMMVHRTFLGGQNAFLPSHFTFTGLNTAQRSESTMAMAKVGFQYQVVGDLYGIVQANVASVLTPLNQCIDNKYVLKPQEWIYGFGATVAYNLSFLPFDITLCYSPDYKFNVSVNVGFLF